MSCECAAAEKTWMQEQVKELKYQLNWGKQFAVWMVYQLWIPVVFAAANGYRVDKDIEAILQDAVLLKTLLFMPLQILQQLQRTHGHVKKTAEKSSFIEARIMKAVEPMTDATRIVGQDVCNYSADKGGRTWLIRRLRVHYESYMKANPCLKHKTTAELIWTFCCTEVLLRNCRDCIDDRLHYLKSEDGIPMPWGWVQYYKNMLKNFMLKFEFWEPMETAKQWEDMQNMEGNLQYEDGSCLERCWISQLMERKLEFVRFLEMNPEHREELLEGMPPLIQYFAAKVKPSPGQSAGDSFAENPGEDEKKAK